MAPMSEIADNGGQARHAGDAGVSQSRRHQTLLRTVTLEADGLQALRSALEGELGRRMLAAVDIVLTLPGRTIVTGMGKSGHVGRKIASTLASTGTPAMFVHPAEASHGDLGMITRDDAVVALSWSGEASELGSIVEYTRRFKVSLIAITSRAESTLGTAADLVLALPRMPEACPNGLAPTTSTTMQLAVGDAFAMCLLDARGFSPADFSTFHPGGKLGARLKRAGDLMFTGADLPLIKPAATLGEAIHAMTSRRSGIAGITAPDGLLLSVLTDGDLRRAFNAGGSFQTPVEEVMTKTPVIATPDILAADLLGMMNTRRITSLFVVENGRPVGILHMHDLLRAGLM